MQVLSVERVNILHWRTRQESHLRTGPRSEESPTVLINLLILGAVLITQGATIYIVRHLVRRWCLRVFESGHRAGIVASDPFKECYRLGYDIGFEAGVEARTDEYERSGR